MQRQPYATLIKNRGVVFALLLMIVPQVNAEVVVNLYGGTGFTQKHNANVNLPDAGISGTHKALQFDTAATVGGRAAYWIDSFPYLGLGIDTSHFFGPDQKNQIALTELCVVGEGCSTSPETIKKFNNNVTTIGFDAMFRYPMLRSEEFSHGQLQPYLTIGPAIFITTLKDTDNFIPAGQSSTYTSLGVKAGAGLMLFLTKRMGAFIEYRDSNFKVKDHYNNAKVEHGITLGKTLGSAIFNIQAIVAGVNIRF